VFYFEVARDLKRARSDDSSKVFKDASTLAFFVAALFAVSGGLQILYSRLRRKAGLVE
jgi:diacylglycerol kinase